VADETRQLRSTWTGWLQKHRGEFAAPRDFNRTVDDQVTAVLRLALQTAKPGISPGEIANVLATLPQNHSATFDNLNSAIKSQYANLFTHYHRIVDERRQHDWATTVDHIKFFVWRTAQAIAFAAVVLGTAYLAQVLGITFTLTRLIPP